MKPVIFSISSSGTIALSYESTASIWILTLTSMFAAKSVLFLSLKELAVRAERSTG